MSPIRNTPKSLITNKELDQQIADKNRKIPVQPTLNNTNSAVNLFGNNRKKLQKLQISQLNKSVENLEGNFINEDSREQQRSRFLIGDHIGLDVRMLKYQEEIRKQRDEQVKRKEEEKLKKKQDDLKDQQRVERELKSVGFFRDWN